MPVSSFSLAELRDLSGARRTTPTGERVQVDITLGLLEMRKAGLVLRIHCHQSRLAVELPGAEGVKRVVSWAWAAKIVQEYRLREAPKAQRGANIAGSEKIRKA